MAFIKYTTGLECWIETRGTAQPERLALVCVDFEREGDNVRGALVSACNFGVIKNYRPVTLTADTWADRPHDPYDDTVEALWALELFNLRPAAIA